MLDRNDVFSLQCYNHLKLKDEVKLFKILDYDDGKVGQGKVADFRNSKT